LWQAAKDIGKGVFFGRHEYAAHVLERAPSALPPMSYGGGLSPHGKRNHAIA
jgi:hypothetical protein